MSNSIVVLLDPGSFTTLNVTKVNTYGIVLHWQGSNETALPVLMTAHQGKYTRSVLSVCFRLQIY